MRGAEIGLAHIQGVVESAPGEHRAAAEQFGRAGRQLAAAGQSAGAALLDAYRARELVAAGEPVLDRFRMIAEQDLADISDKRMAALTSMLRAFAVAEVGDIARVRDLTAQALRECDVMEDLLSGLHVSGSRSRAAAGWLDRRGAYRGANGSRPVSGKGRPGGPAGYRHATGTAGRRLS
jgi:hypothetical protein